MSAFSTLIIESRHSGDDVANFTQPHSGDISASIESVARYVHGYAVGAWRGDLLWRMGAVKARAILALSGQPSDSETFVLCGTTFTAKTSGATGNEFNIGATVPETLANIAAAVNASATTKVTGSVTSSVISATQVAFDAIDAGAAGNGYVLTESMSNTTRTDFTGGSDGTETVLSAGGAS